MFHTKNVFTSPGTELKFIQALIIGIQLTQLLQISALISIRPIYSLTDAYHMGRS